MEVFKTAQFDRWLMRLRDIPARSAILVRLEKIGLSDSLEGDVKSLGGDLVELRVHSGPGYRLYATLQGHSLIVMLAGGDKSSQKRDIEKARKLARKWEGVPE